MALKTSLSQHLRAIDAEALRRATEHPFLKSAAEGSLPQEHIVTWLAQDRLYALSYVTFMGQLLAKVPISTGRDRTSTLHWRITDCLINCLDNIRRELKLFEDVAKKHGWIDKLHHTKPTAQTQAYKDLFAGAGQASSTLFRGMVALWATEKCYLLAWTHAKAHLPKQGEQEKQRDVLQDVFIPNWSGEEFVEFVDVLEKLVDEMAQSASEQDVTQAEEQWSQVLWAEESFWPNIAASNRRDA
jgi:thiaminase